MPHHLLSVLDPADTWTVRDFRARAIDVIDGKWGDRGEAPLDTGAGRQAGKVELSPTHAAFVNN